MYLIKMKKRALAVFVIFLLIICFLPGFASGAEAEQIKKAYDCLKGMVNSSSSLTLEQATFSTLALGDKYSLVSTIKSFKSTSAECWPKTGCTLRDTALVALAYKKAGKDNSKIIDWLLTQNGTTSDLSWYLQITIDGNEIDSCTLRYDGADYGISINDQMKLEGNPGSCLSIDSSGYKLRITDICLDKSFEIFCDKGFKTNLLYEKNTGGTLYVSANTHKGDAGGSTLEKITARCLKQGASCNYEGTLWASLALYQAGKATSDFVPYLLASSGNNEMYFPSAFLRILTNRADQYSDIIEKRSTGFWAISNSPYNSYYDTSLAMLALEDSEIIGGGTVSYLLGQGSPGRQTDKGCWNSNSIRDTAFILYAGPSSWGGTFTGTCKNGVIEGTEVCECGADKVCGNSDDDVEGKDCEDKNYDSGELYCSDNCQEFDLSDCAGGSGTIDENCGNGVLEADELCECGKDEVCGNADDNVSSTCTARGYTGGKLYCKNCKEYKVSDCTGGGSSATLKDCLVENYFCGGRYECAEARGTVLDENTYSCFDPFDYCCTAEIGEELKDCTTELGGSVCSAEQECSGSIQPSSDGVACCLDTCVDTASGESCEETYGGTCRMVCQDNEQDITAICSDISNICCIANEPSEGGIPWWVIVILIILILLVLLAIIFRNKLRLYWYKVRGKAKSSNIPPGSSGPSQMGPPGRFVPRPMPSFGMRRPMPTQPQRGGPGTQRNMPPQPKTKAQAEKEKEYKETLERLKKMSE
jgi:hypothetical protein